mmetsp:Transcript_12738/g.28150  ORF Transcript_12738/g.28150 Transcript_12738/m.28150 type:complete len:288 (+) Transcript_12738:440-1303(+)
MVAVHPAPPAPASRLLRLQVEVSAVAGLPGLLAVACHALTSSLVVLATTLASVERATPIASFAAPAATAAAPEAPGAVPRGANRALAFAATAVPTEGLPLAAIVLVALLLHLVAVPPISVSIAIAIAIAVGACVPAVPVAVAITFSFSVLSTTTSTASVVLRVSIPPAAPGTARTSVSLAGLAAARDYCGRCLASIVLLFASRGSPPATTAALGVVGLSAALAFALLLFLFCLLLLLLPLPLALSLLLLLLFLLLLFLLLPLPVLIPAAIFGSSFSASVLLVATSAP